jgi:hypothetical protein
MVRHVSQRLLISFTCITFTAYAQTLESPRREFASPPKATRPMCAGGGLAAMLRRTKCVGKFAFSMNQALVTQKSRRFASA